MARYNREDFMTALPQIEAEIASFRAQMKKELKELDDKIEQFSSGVADVKVNGTSVVTNSIANVTVPTKVSQLTNDSGFITGYTETDPTVPSWAKASSKPSYNFSEIGSKPTTLSGYGITDAKIANGTITLGSNTITPLTSFTETDPTVPAWAKASSKPSYTASEVGALATSDKMTLSGAGNLGWTNQTDGDAKIPAKSVLAFWNGAYSGTASNLKYCSNGVMIGGSQIVRQGWNTNCTAKSVAANGGTITVTCTMTKSGWLPIGLAGVDVSTPSGLAIRRQFISASSSGSVTVTVELTNTTGSAISVTTSHVVACYVIWAKIS